MTKAPIELTNTRYRLGYHVAAPSGWVNDPNGFCYFDGYYHVFYQHHPYTAEWGPMHWGHARSRDLIHWENLPIALTPGDPEDEDGCFSGSAIEKDGVLYLFYTGHHYYGDNDPDHFWQNQNMAYSTDGVHFTKYEHNPIIASEPEDNTHHFRDPKVWQQGDNYYMVLGSQGKDGLGRAIIYRSKDLKDWTYLGEMAKATSLAEEGFMWECPDFFTLDGEEALLLSPQGIEAQEEQYLNLFQTGYFIGNYDEKTNQFHHGGFKELDAGHDFYATQTTLAPDGRRIVIGWMAMWESEMPEKVDGWAGALTLPRELTLHGDQLRMRPVKELAQLRESELDNFTKGTQKPIQLSSGKQQVELNITLENTSFELHFKAADGKVQMTLAYDRDQQKFTLSRADREDARFVKVATPTDIQLQIFVDTSSAEIFINDGEATFTERFYLEGAPDIWLKTDEAVSCKASIYQLKANTITF